MGFKNKMTKTGEICTLQISGVTEKMSGVYKCVATNKDGTTEHKTVVMVGEKPKEPVDKPEVEPQKPTEKVETSAPEEPKDEGKPKEEPQLKKEVQPEEVLKPEAPKHEEEPKPKEEEKAKPKPTTEAPTFIETFEETTVKPKSTLTLTAKVTGKPEPTVTWFRDDKEIQKTFKNKMTKTGEICTLQISGVTEKMSGVYKCVATNKDGTTEHETVVMVGEKPKEHVDKPEEEPQNPTEKVEASAQEEPMRR